MAYRWSSKPAYTTDEALTLGIAYREIHVGGNGKYFYNKTRGFDPVQIDESYIHSDLDSAIAHCEHIRDFKIMELESRIKSLSNIDFGQVRICKW